MRGNSGVDNFARGLGVAAGAAVTTLEAAVIANSLSRLLNIGGTVNAITADFPTGQVALVDGADYWFIPEQSTREDHGRQLLPDAPHGAVAQPQDPLRR